MRMNPFIKSIKGKNNPIQKPIAKRGVNHNQPARNSQPLKKINEIKEKNKYIHGFIDKTPIEQKIYNRLENFETVVFGPMIMEFGWEIIWSGFIKKYKLDNPNKNIVVWTRDSRGDLYRERVDEIFYLNINGDYNTYSPRTNKLVRLDSDRFKFKEEVIDSEKMFFEQLNQLKSLYPNCIFYNFSDIGYTGSSPINLKRGHYDFCPSTDNKITIENIISKHPDKKIVVLYPRHRIDLNNDRNWSKENWEKFYLTISSMNDYLFFVSGVSPSYIKPSNQYNNIIDLEDIKLENPLLTVIGLTIEAMRYCKFTFGIQSGLLLLSRFMQVPSLYIGYNDRDMCTKEFNPFDTISVNIKPIKNKNGYEIDFKTVFDKFKEFLISKRDCNSKQSYSIETNKELEGLFLDYNKYSDGTPIEFSNNYDKISSIKVVKRNPENTTNPIHVYAPPGIGDALWPLQYVLANTDRPIYLHTWKRPGFASKFLLGIKNVIAVEEFDSIKGQSFNNYSKYVDHSNKKNSSYSKLTDLNNIEEIYMEVNHHIEQGLRIENYYPNLKFTFDIPWEITKEDSNIVDRLIDNKKIILLYSSSYKNNKFSDSHYKDINFNKFNPDSWTDIVVNLLNNIDNNTKIIWIGAEYDFDLQKYVMNKLTHPRKNEILHLVDMPCGPFIDLLRKSKCFISYQSGLSVISLVEQTPTYMLYFKHLSKLHYSFCHPNMVDDREKYYCCKFDDHKIDAMIKWTMNNLNK